MTAGYAERRFQIMMDAFEQVIASHLGVLAHVRERLPGDPVDQHAGCDGSRHGEAVNEPVIDSRIGAQLLKIGVDGDDDAAFQAVRAQVEDEPAQLAEGQTQGLLEVVQDVQFVRSPQPEPQLLQAQASGGDHLDGVVVNFGGDPGAFFLLHLEQATDQGLAVYPFRFQQVQASLDEESIPLHTGDVPDGHNSDWALPGVQGDDADFRGKLTGIAAASHQLDAPGILPGLSGATGWPVQYLIWEQVLDEPAIQVPGLVAEQGRGPGVSLHDPPDAIDDDYGVWGGLEKLAELALHGAARVVTAHYQSIPSRWPRRRSAGRPG